MGRKAINTAQDWVLAAFSTLDAEGISGVKVERLAKKLGTTKGSFYWHFADRPALLTAMLDFWDQEGTKGIIEILNDGEPAPQHRLIKLMELATMTEVHGLDAARVEGALRAWAGQDKEVAARIAKTEQDRVVYVEQILRELGYSSNIATQKAQQLYLLLLGFYSIARHNHDPVFKQRVIDFAHELAAQKA